MQESLKTNGVYDLLSFLWPVMFSRVLNVKWALELFAWISAHGSVNWHCVRCNNPKKISQRYENLNMYSKDNTEHCSTDFKALRKRSALLASLAILLNQGW